MHQRRPALHAQLGRTVEQALRLVRAALLELMHQLQARRLAPAVLQGRTLAQGNHLALLVSLATIPLREVRYALNALPAQSARPRWLRALNAWQELTRQCQPRQLVCPVPLVPSQAPLAQPVARNALLVLLQT